jgi:hypothetical protein
MDSGREELMEKLAKSTRGKLAVSSLRNACGKLEEEQHGPEAEEGWEQQRKCDYPSL